MRKKEFFILGLCFLAFLFLFACDVGDSGDLTKSFEVEFLVIEELENNGDESALVGVEVTFDGETKESDEDGVVSFGEYEEGSYELKAKAEGYEDYGPYDFEVDEGSLPGIIVMQAITPAEARRLEFVASDQEVRAGEAGHFTIEVQDEFGNATTEHEGLEDIISITDDAGNLNPEEISIEQGESELSFTWGHTVVGEYQITVSHNGLDSDSCDVKIIPGEVEELSISVAEEYKVDEGIEIMAGEAGNFTIAVQDEFGNATTEHEGLEDIISITNNVGNLNPEEISIEQGESELSFSWGHTVVGEYQITASHNGLDSDSCDVKIIPGEVEELSISVAKEYKVDGGIEIIAGEEVEILVNIEDVYGNLIKDSISSLKWTGAEDGIFSKELVGDYEVILEYKGVSDSLDITVIAAEASKLAFVDSDTEVVAGEEGYFVLEVQDEFGNATNEHDGLGVDLIIHNPDGNIMLEDSVFIEEEESRVDFVGDVNVSGVYTLSTDHSDFSSISHEVTIVAAKASQFAFIEVVDEFAAGEGATFAVEVQDEFGNATTDHSGLNDIISIAPDEGDFEAINIANNESEVSFEWYCDVYDDYEITANVNDIDKITHNVTVTPFADGEGTEEDPYQIANAVQLNNVRDFLLDDEYEPVYVHYIQIEDIDLDEFTSWDPIGYFTGVFDGNGFEISNLTIDTAEEEYLGLFAETKNAELMNISLKNVNITGKNYVGALVGDSDGDNAIMINCSVYGNIEGNDFVGGLVGDNEADISYSYFDGRVKGDVTAGGLVGQNYYGDIEDSYSIGIVEGNSCIGGLVGYHQYSNVIDSYSEAKIQGGSTLGGLVGVFQFDGEIINCYATGDVNGSESSSQVGGLVGSNHSSIKNSFASGNVEGESNIGGLVGSDYGNINNSYATGNVSASFGYFGGLVGYSSESIENSYATGKITVIGEDTPDYIGGLVGSGSGAINSYWDIETSGINESDIGEGRTTVQMQTGTPGDKLDEDGNINETEGDIIYQDWDENIWDFGTENDYPILLNITY